MHLSISDVLAQVESAKDFQSKLDILRANWSVSLMAILAGAYDPRVEWLLPKGRPPFQPAPAGQFKSVLYSQTRTFFNYTKDGGGPAMTQPQREGMFIQLLQALDPDDANLVIHMVNKQLPYPSITPGLIATAFPGVLKGVEPDRTWAPLSVATAWAPLNPVGRATPALPPTMTSVASISEEVDRPPAAAAVKRTPQEAKKEARKRYKDKQKAKKTQVQAPQVARAPGGLPPVVEPARPTTTLPEGHISEDKPLGADFGESFFVSGQGNGQNVPQ